MRLWCLALLLLLTLPAAAAGGKALDVHVQGTAPAVSPDLFPWNRNPRPPDDLQVQVSHRLGPGFETLLTASGSSSLELRQKLGNLTLGVGSQANRPQISVGMHGTLGGLSVNGGAQARWLPQGLVQDLRAGVCTPGVAQLFAQGDLTRAQNQTLIDSDIGVRVKPWGRDQVSISSHLAGPPGQVAVKGWTGSYERWFSSRVKVRLQLELEQDHRRAYEAEYMYNLGTSLSIGADISRQTGPGEPAVDSEGGKLRFAW